jgi:hypothetical protein
LLFHIKSCGWLHIHKNARRRGLWNCKVFTRTRSIRIDEIIDSFEIYKFLVSLKEKIAKAKIQDFVQTKNDIIRPVRHSFLIFYRVLLCVY